MFLESLELFRENIQTGINEKKFRNMYWFNLKPNKRTLETAIHFIHGRFIEIYISHHKSLDASSSFPTIRKLEWIFSLGFALTA